MVRGVLVAIVGLGLIGVSACSSGSGGSQGSSRIAVLMNELDGTIDKDVGAVLKAQPVDWGRLAPLAQRFADITAEVSRNPPPKGSVESWGKLSSAFAANGRRLHDAAQMHDRNDAYEAWNDLHRSCVKCHQAHR
jgi:cytochrome c556